MRRLPIILFALFCFAIDKTNAQTPEPYKELRFSSYNPNWVSVSQDETFQTVQQWDKYGRILPSFKFYQPPALIEGNFLYSALRTGTWDLEGFLLEKRSLKTGEIVWKKTHDMRNHSRQEAPFTMRINDEGELQLINYRRISPPDNPAFPGGFASGGDASHLSIMEFDTATGALIRHQYPESNDTTAAEIRQYYKYRNQLHHVENDTFQWLSFKRDLSERFTGSIGVHHSSLIHNSVVTKIDSAFQQFDTSQFEQSDIRTKYERRCYQYSADSIYCVNYYHSRTDRSQWYGSIDLYDRHFNLLSTNDISDIVPFSVHLQIFSVTKNNILLYSSDYTATDDDRFISLNKSGELNEVLYLNTVISKGTGIGRMIAIENPNNNNLIIFSMDYINQLLYIMKSDGQGNLIVTRTLETFLPSYVAYPIQLMYDSINNNLIALLMHARYEFVNNHSIYHGNWSNWVSLPFEDFVAVEDEEQPQLRFASVYPNPTSGELTINYPFEEDDRIRLYTTDGKLVEVYKTDISIDNLQIHLPHGLPSGTYIIQCQDSRNRFKFSNSVILR